MQSCTLTLTLPCPMPLILRTLPGPFPSCFNSGHLPVTSSSRCPSCTVPCHDQIREKEGKKKKVENREKKERNSTAVFKAVFEKPSAEPEVLYNAKWLSCPSWHLGPLRKGCPILRRYNAAPCVVVLLRRRAKKKTYGMRRSSHLIITMIIIRCTGIRVLA